MPTDKVELHHSHYRAVDALDQIQLMVNEDLPRVKESVFKEYFLPVLTGEINENHKDEKIRLDYWVNHATVRKAQNGNPTAPNPNLPVRVVDDNDPNVILFTVPAIIPSFDEAAERSRVSITKVINVAMKKEEMHPMVGKRWVDGIFDEAFSSTRTQELSMTQKQWLAILIRYNLTEKVIGVKLEGSSTTAEPTNQISQAFSDEIDEL